MSNDPATDTSGNPLVQKRIPGTVNTLNHPFSPTPLGGDLFAQMGNNYAMPIVGNFDPPVTTTSTGPTISGVVTAVTGANPVVTWTLDDSAGIASTTFTVNGKNVPVFGPYGSKTHANYAAAIAGLNLAVGSHSFVIQATDSALTPISAQYSGSFTLVTAVTTGPTINQVVVSQARGKISWNATDPAGVKSSTLTIDGKAVSGVAGPFAAASGVNFSAPLGSLGVGDHTYAITVVDKTGHSFDHQRDLYHRRGCQQWTDDWPSGRIAGQRPDQLERGRSRRGGEFDADNRRESRVGGRRPIRRGIGRQFLGADWLAHARQPCVRNYRDRQDGLFVQP